MHTTHNRELAAEDAGTGAFSCQFGTPATHNRELAAEDAGTGAFSCQFGTPQGVRND